MLRFLALLTVVFAAGLTSAAEPKVAERWAVLVGVDDYANANDLQYCGADQTALRDRLLAAGFRPQNIILLHDKATENKYRPSQRNIEQQLRLIINNAEADDLLVVGFSGHGVSLAGKSYLCPSDAALADPTTLIALDSVYEQLRDCAARFKLVLVDACRNDPVLGGQRSLAATEGTKQLARSLQDLKLPQGVVLLNSCAPGEISWEEKDFGHGVYMHYVLEALGGAADADGDRAVSLNELQRYASGRTRSYVTGKFNSSQRPFYRSEGESEAMDYALLPVKANIATVPPVDPRDTRFPPWPTIKPNQPWIGESRWLANQREIVLCGVLKDGPAGKAGLRTDDTILAVGGRKVTGNRNFYEAIEAHRPGETVEFEIERDGRQLKVPVTLEPIPPDGGNGRILAAAEAGESWAMMDIGVRYAGMRNEFSYFDKNDAEAIRWFRRSMEAGYTAGPFFLAIMYEGGRGVGQDLAQAATLYEQSRAMQGEGVRKGLYSSAASSLGNLYLQGAGVPKDVAKGLQLYREAAAAGGLGAQTQLGKMHEIGQGVAQSYAKAMQEYQVAAQAGYGPAEYAVGLLIYNGRGFQKDANTARGWFANAAEHGSADAMFALGRMEEVGEGGPRNPAAAFDWYRKAADKGHAEAKKKVQ